VSPRGPRNITASIRQRLLNLSRERGEDFQLILTQYANERLLYRLGRSAHGHRFLLKGAMLFALWTGRMHRPTRDLDLLGQGDPDEEALTATFRGVCSLPVEDDGLEFEVGTVAVEAIREDQEYGGQRVRFRAWLAGARIDLQVDVGFGDAVTPAPEAVDYPTLLDLPAPRLRAYPRETVVAEKLQAMVRLGIANTRMKDFFDLWIISREFEFRGRILQGAIRATFERRRTEIPENPPIALTPDFARDVAKGKQWQAFLSRSGVRDRATDLEPLIEHLSGFLLPPLRAARVDAPFGMLWSRGGPWR
jgi:predicted nucleotidyltransferase component of viral defense system